MPAPNYTAAGIMKPDLMKMGFILNAFENHLNK